MLYRSILKRREGLNFSVCPRKFLKPRMHIQTGIQTHIESDVPGLNIYTHTPYRERINCAQPRRQRDTSRPQTRLTYTLPDISDIQLRPRRYCARSLSCKNLINRPAPVYAVARCARAIRLRYTHARYFESGTYARVITNMISCCCRRKLWYIRSRDFIYSGRRSVR